MQHINRFIYNNSCTTRLNSSLLSLTLAVARIPYVGIPSCAIIRKYATKEVAKLTLPVPDGDNILDTYGNEMSGNIIDESDKIPFIIKFFFIELFLFIHFYYSSGVT